jgi:hypothetical protein
MEAVKKWRYRPRYKNDKPVETKTQIVVEFSITIQYRRIESCVTVVEGSENQPLSSVMPENSGQNVANLGPNLRRPILLRRTEFFLLRRPLDWAGSLDELISFAGVAVRTATCGYDPGTPHLV